MKDFKKPVFKHSLKYFDSISVLFAISVDGGIKEKAMDSSICVSRAFISQMDNISTMVNHCQCDCVNTCSYQDILWIFLKRRPLKTLAYLLP